MPPVKLVINPADTPLPVSTPNTTIEGRIVAATQAVTIPVPPGASAIGVQFTGTWAGTLTFEATVDGATWVSMIALDTTNGAVSSATANGAFIFPCAGLAAIRIRASSWTSGQVAISANATTGATGLISGLVAGDVNVGNVDVASIAAGDNNIGNVDIVTLPGIAGDVAHSTTDSGNPVKIGAVAIAHGTNPTAVDAAERTNLYANRAGIQFVIGGHPNVQTLRVNYTTAQTDTATVTIAGGLKIVVTAISALLDNACTVDVSVTIGFGTATTPTTLGVVLSHPGLVAGSGIVSGNGSGILGVGADGEDLRVTSEVPTGGSLTIVIHYYTIES